MKDIQMVDLRGQYLAIKDEIDTALQEVIDETSFIGGSVVGQFECELAGLLGGSYVAGVANGTDALQVALMALEIGPGDEIITPSFTFVATAEAASLLGARAVFADIDARTFNLDPEQIEPLITERTRAILPVHLFGHPADMDPILRIAEKHNLYVIEDNAQSIGAAYKGRSAGFMGDTGTLSFFPSKNLGAYGDGGAVLTNDAELYEAMRLIANHGSRKKYHNERVGVNSRLDTMQAAVLRAKLPHLDRYSGARRSAADRYDALFSDVPYLETPYRDPDVEHVFHQYTLRISSELPGGRDALAAHLRKQGIPHAVYYPVPLHRLPVYADLEHAPLPETERAAAEVISLPMHTELTEEQQTFIAGEVVAFVRLHA